MPALVARSHPGVSASVQATTSSASPVPIAERRRRGKTAVSAWPAEACELFLQRFGPPATGYQRRLARAFDRWLAACAAEGADADDVSFEAWNRRSRHLGAADRNAMRAVLAELYGASAELYPRLAPKVGRCPREKLRADLGAALARWPIAWRERGAQLLHVDDDPLFDGRLVKSWASSTVVVTARALARLFDNARGAGLEPDVSRAVLRGYLKKAQQRVACGELSVNTVAITLQAAYSLASVLFPEREWLWLRDAERGMKGLAKKAPTRNASRAHPAPELYLVGCALFAEATARLAQAGARRERTRAYRLARVGLAVVLLIAMPVRIGALAGLRIGEHIDADFGRLRLAAKETKERRADEREIPEPVRALMKAFMTFRAPIAARPETCLFVSERSGGPMTSGALSREIVTALKNALGRPINPHAFRHSAAGFIVSEAPAEAALASTVLNHSSPSMTRRYQTAADQIVAGRALRKAALV